MKVLYFSPFEDIFIENKPWIHIVVRKQKHFIKEFLWILITSFFALHAGN